MDEAAIAARVNTHNATTARGKAPMPSFRECHGPASTKITVDIWCSSSGATRTYYPWKEPEELRQRTIERARRFLKAHIR